MTRLLNKVNVRNPELSNTPHEVWVFLKGWKRPMSELIQVPAWVLPSVGAAPARRADWNQELAKALPGAECAVCRLRCPFFELVTFEHPTHEIDRDGSQNRYHQILLLKGRMAEKPLNE